MRLAKSVACSASISASRSVPAVGAEISPRRIPSAHSASDGPATIGPSQVTVSSVKIETSAAREFISSSGLSAARQIRPEPGMCGSTTSTCSGAVARCAACAGWVALAASRSSTPIARGPPPTRTRRVLAAAPLPAVLRASVLVSAVLLTAVPREFIRRNPF